MILNDNKIDDLSKLHFSNNLKSLSLSKNQIKRFNSNGNLFNLIILDLSHNQLESLKDEYYNNSEIVTLKSILNLDLSFNRITHIDTHLKNLTSLEVLSISNNQIEDVDGLDRLKKLRILKLNKNRLKDVSKIKNLIKMEYLYLNENQIDDLCSWIGDLKYLKTLHASNNEINNFDCLHDTLSNLDLLDLSFNQLKNVSSLRYLINLKNLNLNNNQIEDISDLQYLRYVDKLFINNNNVKCLSPIGNLNLKYLEINDNQIENILWIKNSSNLRELKISNNKLNQLPNRLFDNFMSLSKIDLSLNQIKSIDSFDCRQKTKINKLDLSNNQLENVDFIFDCSIINEIRLNNNQIRHIQLEILSYYYLKILDISFNPIEVRNQNLINLKIGENLMEIVLSINSIDLIQGLTNNRLIKQNEKNAFYKVLYIVLIDKLDYFDCKIQLDFLKRNILLNLFYSYQIDYFLSFCNKI